MNIYYYKDKTLSYKEKKEEKRSIHAYFFSLLFWFLILCMFELAGD
jgi:hypothetical protein